MMTEPIQRRDFPLLMTEEIGTNIPGKWKYPGFTTTSLAPVPKAAGISLARKAGGNARMREDAFGGPQELRRSLAKVIKKLVACLFAVVRRPRGI